MPALIAAALLAAQAADEAPGPRKINVRTAWFYKEASRLSETVRQAEYGETVTVTAFSGKFAQVVLREGGEAFVFRSALVPPEGFKPGPANEEEIMRLKAQGYEAGRFDPETEKKYREQKGPAIDAAYRQLDAFEARALGRAGRPVLEGLLKDFRREGRLGEFANVR